MTLSALDEVASAVGGPELDAALRWAAAGFSVRALTSELQQAAMRVSGLVVAIKGFTHMDQAAVAEPIDLTRGLSDTVAVLRSKAKGKSATVAIDVAPDLPKVNGFIGELNQVWVQPDRQRARRDSVRRPRQGRLRTGRHAGGRAHRRQRGWYRAGDPRTDLRSIFHDQAGGQGTGLGLDIVRRLVRHNEGDIEVESQPGRTEFRVWLPLAAN